MTTVEEELELLRAKFGRLVPREIREAVFGQPEEYPALHQRLSRWTAEEAWERFIDGQIAEIIRTVRVVVETESGVIPVRRYVNVREDDGEHRYEDIQVVRRSADLVEQVLKQMEADYAALQAKYAHHRDYFRDMIRRSLDDE